MWYTVLSCTEFDADGYKAGTIYNCVKRKDGKVGMYRVDPATDHLEQTPSFLISPEVARKFFSKPTKSFTDAMEQSFMVCEAAYC